MSFFRDSFKPDSYHGRRLIERGEDKKKNWVIRAEEPLGDKPKHGYRPYVERLKNKTADTARNRVSELRELGYRRIELR